MFVPIPVIPSQGSGIAFFFFFRPLHQLATTSNAQPVADDVEAWATRAYCRSASP